MDSNHGSRAFEAALALLASRVGDALQEFSSAISVRAGVPTAAVAEVEQELGIRQRQILEIDGLADSDGMKVSQIAESISYDAANASLALRALERRGLVERVPGKTPQHWRLSESAQQRRRVWAEPELILALDLYLRRGAQPPQQDLESTKALLDQWALANGYRPRPMGGLVFKLGNLHAIATDGAEGFAHGGAADLDVWNRYADDKSALTDAAADLKRQLDRSNWSRTQLTRGLIRCDLCGRRADTIHFLTDGEYPQGEGLEARVEAVFACPAHDAGGYTADLDRWLDGSTGFAQRVGEQTWGPAALAAVNARFDGLLRKATEGDRTPR